MTSAHRIQVGRVRSATLSGSEVVVEIKAARQTSAALLLKREARQGRRLVSTGHWWLPKSEILVNGEPASREIDLETVQSIDVPDWLFRKRGGINW